MGVVRLPLSGDTSPWTGFPWHRTEGGVTGLGEVMIDICFSIPSSSLLPAYHTNSRIICFLTASNTHVRKINPLTSPTQCNRKYAPTKTRNSAQARILCWLKHVYWEFDRHIHNSIKTRVVRMVKNPKVIHIWVSSFWKHPNKHHPGKTAGGIMRFFIFFFQDSGTRSENNDWEIDEQTRTDWRSKDGCLSALGKKMLRLGSSANQ